MSRALNLNLTQEQVQAAVLKQKAAVTSIEPLFPRGTRVVMKNADQAATMRRVLKASLIYGTVTRTPLRTQKV